MADQSKPTLTLNKAPASAPAPSTSQQVTYVPGPEDPPTTKWAGYTFNANVPKTVTNADLIERAKGNRFFRVGAFDPSKDSVTVQPTTLPTTPEQYRSYAAEWLKTVKTVDDLDTRWVEEEKLREKCGVGTDDLDFLMALFQPKRHELRKMASGY